MNDKGNDAKEKIRMLRGMRQVRRFTSESVPDDVVEDIIEVGRWTGSGMNRQPWEFMLVRNHDTLRHIAEEEGANSHLANADFAIIMLMAGESPVIENFDEGRLTERLLLAAAAHGLGAGVWWLREKGKAAARRILGIPEELNVRTAISFGYPAPEVISERKSNPEARKSREELVHEERY
ncbi:MAG TPA: nitroreductase family protein [Chloroflexia bacterium]|nr:nitroreductase family protein [Chloroflexia bacterium]